MKKSTKVLLGTLGVLAAMDLSDIAAKGQTLAVMSIIDKDAADETEEAIYAAWENSKFKPIVHIRLNMIKSCKEILLKRFN